MAELLHPEWALILGGASCVWDDVRALEEVYGKEWDGLVIAANDIGAHWPGELDAWVSLHSTKFSRWVELRIQNKQPSSRPYETWGKTQCGNTDHEITQWAGGSSGLFAVQVALIRGCTRAVLCGVPMTVTPHFEETKEAFAKEWQAANAHFKVWPRQAHRMVGWVKSMSGRTRELLGAPTKEWLLGE